ncbi:MAG: Tab2/Atab2 family RNA-binding protein [Spirulinaceae cyanobacterium]
MENQIWELDFYSRPILDEQQKKLWEVLICESPGSIDSSPEELFQYSKFCSNKTVNSIWLREAIEEAIASSTATPKKIRFFRRQMNNMIVKAAEEIGIIAVPSRRTYGLQQLLEKRLEEFYPTQPGFAPALANTAAVQYPDQTPSPLPDATRGDKGDKWAFVTLEAGSFQDMAEWDIAFGENLPLTAMEINPETKIPGLIIFSPRALPFAGWLSGLEMAFLRFDGEEKAKLLLETGLSDSWILANLTDGQTIAEAQGFEVTKAQAKGIHFLAIQSKAESESFAGFWLLKQV